MEERGSDTSRRGRGGSSNRPGPSPLPGPSSLPTPRGAGEKGGGSPVPESLGFEEALERVEEIIEKVESGEIGLEESIAEYERGAALIAHCRKILDRAEQKVEELTRGGDGGANRRSDGGGEERHEGTPGEEGGRVGGRAGRKGSSGGVGSAPAALPPAPYLREGGLTGPSPAPSPRKGVGVPEGSAEDGEDDDAEPPF